MLKTLLGNNPRTTIAGAVLAGLFVLQTELKHGISHWYDVAIPVVIAILGRLSADSQNTKP